jgi:hypothetical protein
VKGLTDAIAISTGRPATTNWRGLAAQDAADKRNASARHLRLCGRGGICGAAGFDGAWRRDLVCAICSHGGVERDMETSVTNGLALGRRDAPLGLRGSPLPQEQRLFPTPPCPARSVISFWRSVLPTDTIRGLHSVTIVVIDEFEIRANVALRVNPNLIRQPTMLFVMDPDSDRARVLDLNERLQIPPTGAGSAIDTGKATLSVLQLIQLLRARSLTAEISALPLAFTPEQHEALRKFGDRVLAPLPEA